MSHFEKNESVKNISMFQVLKISMFQVLKIKIVYNFISYRLYTIKISVFKAFKNKTT